MLSYSEHACCQGKGMTKTGIPVPVDKKPEQVFKIPSPVDKKRDWKSKIPFRIRTNIKLRKSGSGFSKPCSIRPLSLCPGQIYANSGGANTRITTKVQNNRVMSGSSFEKLYIMKI